MNSQIDHLVNAKHITQAAPCKAGPAMPCGPDGDDGYNRMLSGSLHHEHQLAFSRRGFRLRVLAFQAWQAALERLGREDTRAVGSAGMISNLPPVRFSSVICFQQYGRVCFWLCFFHMYVLSTTSRLCFWVCLGLFFSANIYYQQLLGFVFKKSCFSVPCTSISKRWVADSSALGRAWTSFRELSLQLIARCFQPAEWIDRALRRNLASPAAPP
ncbi:MAG: hypothetical protein WB819_05540 [Terriglobia bacterium]